MNRLLLKTTAIALLASCVHVGAAEWNTNDDGVVLDGYDVVAYRTMAQAVPGKADYEAQYDGATFYFSSADHLAAFNENPARFAPKYNGFCAFAVGAKNAKVPADPETFKMYNGELLVFFNDLWDGKKFNTKVPWNENEQSLAQQAEKNWPDLASGD